MTLHAAPLQSTPADRPPDAWEYSLRLPHGPRSPGVARATVRIVLHEHDLFPYIDNAELLCSELVTNAFRHAEGGDIFVRVLWNAGARTLRLSVRDASPAPPVARTAGPDDTCGRGLFLVRRLAKRWGVYDFRHNGGGKAVWVEL